MRQWKVDLGLLHRMPFRGRARPVLEHVSPYADSGLESYVRLRLRRLGVRVWPQAWVDGHQVDFLIGDRLVLQIDGGHHVGQQRIADIEHDARLQLRGYTVFRVSYTHVVDRWHEVHERLMQAVALGLHRA